ncbi:DUF4190 domain-containing protein [Candidatus Woesearchaeota archaeon]|nr:DUF4190 domain-containing protein [Candidatus Woesearchaeota archaeon]
MGKSGFAITSLVLGIISIPGVIFSFLDIPFSVLAIVFGLVALNKMKTDGSDGKGLAIAGIAMGAITLFLAIIMVLLAIFAISTGLYNLNASTSGFQ